MLVIVSACAFMPSEELFVHKVGLDVPRARPRSYGRPMDILTWRALQTMASLQVVCAAVARSELRHSLLDPARRGFRAHASTELVGCCDVACGDGPVIVVHAHASANKLMEDLSRWKPSTSIEVLSKDPGGSRSPAQRLQSARTYVPPALIHSANSELDHVCALNKRSPLCTGDVQDRVRNECRSRKYP
jgi:hypothetical protein